MILNKEVQFSAEMLLELIMKFNEDEHFDALNGFQEGEDLRTISEDLLHNRLEKSLGIDLDKLKKMVSKDLHRNELVKVAHLAIEIANKHSEDVDKPVPAKKMKKSVDERSNSKGPTVSTAISF